MNVTDRAAKYVLPLICLTGLTGCHSAFVNATVINATRQPIQLFEVDYPNASFGSGQLPVDATFHYRFKVQGDGPIKITWTDGAGAEHTSQGPTVHEGEEGNLSVRLDTDRPTWTAAVHPVR